MAGKANSINEGTTGICGFTGTAFTSTAVTQYNMIVGGSTSSTVANVAPSATSGVPLISQGSSSNPTFGTAVVAGGGTGAATFTQYGVIYGNGTSALGVTATGSAGQVLTSNGSGSAPTYQSTLGSTWTDEAISFAAASNVNYFVTANATATLPASPAQGDSIGFVVTAGSTTLTITGNTGQTIRLGLVASAAAGTAANNAQGDSIVLVYQSASTGWYAISSIGTWTIT